MRLDDLCPFDPDPEERAEVEPTPEYVGWASLVVQFDDPPCVRDALRRGETITLEQYRGLA